MNEKHCIDLLTGYALEILDGEDRLTAEQHLAICTACREEVAVMRETLHGCMGHAVPAAAPDPLVRTKFLAQFAIEVSPGSVVTLPPAVLPPAIDPARGAPPRLRISSRQRLTWLVGGATLPAVAAVIFLVLFLRSQSQLSTQQNTVLAQALHTPHLTMHLTGSALRSGMSGEVLMQQQSSTGVLIVSGIHQVPSGMIYIWWMRKHGQWVDGGALRPDASGMAMVSFEGSTSLAGVDGVAITMEHAGRPTTPSPPMLLTSPI